MINRKAMLAGAISGILAPLFTLLLIYAVKFGKNDIEEFIVIAIEQKIMSSLIALSLISNLALFFIFLWKQNEWAGRGVILSTFLLGTLIVYFKFIA